MSWRQLGWNPNSPHPQTTWARGEPLYVGLMQALAGTHGSKMRHTNYSQQYPTVLMVVKVMWDEYIWGMTDHETELLEKEMHKKTKWLTCTNPYPDHLFLFSLPLKHCMLKYFCGPSSRRASPALINTSSSPQKPLALEDSHWLLLLAQCWFFSACAKPHWWGLG